MKRFAYLFVLALLLQAAFSSCEKEDKTEKTVAVESVSLDQPYLDLMIGETATLKATVLPYHATKKKVTWSSSAPEVASVSGYGQVKALREGSATIIATAGAKKAECEVTVKSQDTPVTDSFPVDVVKALHQESSLIRTLRNSVTYSPHDNVTVTELQYVDYSGNNQAAFVMQVNLADPRISITNTTPGDTDFTADHVQRQKLSEQFKLVDKAGNRVLGGVNTDFFTTSGTYAGRPSSAFWHNGVCYRNVFGSEATRPRSFVWWGDDEHVHMGHSSDYPAAKATGKIKELFSGGQILIENGKVTSFMEDSVYGTHPRTMFGFTSDDRHIVLVVFDGRQKSWSVGVNYPDMQQFMKAIGCHWAINIDGGGSSTFIVRKDGSSFTDGSRFQVKNKPSDGSERAIGPGLAVVSVD